MTINELEPIYSALNTLNKLSVPCGLALAQNLSRVEKEMKKHYELLDQIRDKYVVLDNSVEGVKYKLKPDIKLQVKPLKKDEKPTLKVNQLTYFAFEAKKQKEYEDKIKEATERKVTLLFHKIDLGRKVMGGKNGEKEMTLQEKLDLEFNIPGGLLIPLLDVVFVDSTTSK